MNAPFTWDLQEGVTLIRMAAGPVNALDPDLRRMLSDVLDTALADSAIHVIVLAAEGPVFSAGADLRQIEASPKPVIAALQGHAGPEPRRGRHPARAGA